MNELNPAGVTVMPYICKDEECLGLSQLKAGSLLDTEYNTLFTKPQVQDACCSLLKTDEYKLIGLDCVILSNEDDKRNWTISCDPSGEERICKFLLSVDDIEENQGAIMWIPNSQRLESIPTSDHFKSSYFSDVNTGKIYPMKKRYATTKSGDIIAIHPYNWFSYGLNTTEKETRYIVATYST